MRRAHCKKSLDDHWHDMASRKSRSFSERSFLSFVKKAKADMSFLKKLLQNFS